MLQRVFKSLEDILNLNTSFFFVRRRRSVQQAACFRIPGIKSRTSFERVRRRIRIKWVPHVKPVWKSYIRYDNATKWGVSAKEKRSCSGKPTAKAILRQILHAFIAHPPTHTFNQHNGRFTAHTAWFNTTNPQFPSHNVFICITNWLTDWLTDYMEESPSCEAKRFSPSQEIPHNLWNPKVHYRIHNSLPTAPILTQINKVHVLPSVSCRIHFNIVFPPTARFSEWSLFCRFPPTKPCTHLPSPPHVLHTQHILFFFYNNKQQLFP